LRLRSTVLPSGRWPGFAVWNAAASPSTG